MRRPASLVFVVLLAGACVGSPRDPVRTDPPRSVGADPPSCSHAVDASWPEGSFQSISSDGGGLWAVGSSGRFSREPFLARFDGTDWTPVPAPPGMRATFMHGVAGGASGRAWAVGSRTALGRPVVMRWDGSEWRSMPVPAGFDRVSFNAVAVHAGDVWIAGAGGGPLERPLLVRFDGRSWRRLPIAGPTYASLEEIGSGGGELWAVGYHAFEPLRPLVFVRSRGRWVRSPFDALARRYAGQLFGMAVGDAGRVLAVGYEKRSVVDARAFIAVHGRRGWRRARVAGVRDAYLSAVDAAHGSAWAVGSRVESRRPFVVSRIAGTWRPVAVPQDWSVLDVAVDRQGRAWAVGGLDNGAIGGRALIARLC